ncbi:reverse transcriptase domain-containing protein [Aeromonas jandaei]|uniref:reverse transcriptase domain-containing protein n=1 Tax=Aeromonas jandaei TaxID=650 RepID=UPI00196AF1E2|nr:reverse transcriptase domain-containing protein [Aeromonas jandaei]
MNSRYPELAPAQAWQLAYQWLCQRRRHYPANADIWHLRFHWPARSATLFARVMAGHYRLSPMQLLGGHAIWSAEDALVLKWVALRVAPRLPWHPACEHGRGMGVVASRRRLHDFLQGAGGSHPYVLRTDIRGYYQHIDRARVLSRLVAPLPCPVCRELMRQYLYYSVECGGEFHTPSSGISRGCALSPLIGASLLWHIDADFAARGELYYARYMDDFIVLARTRWRLRDAVRRLNGYLAADGFSQHPAKTWIGRLDRGIDWLGGWYTTQGRVGIAPNALQRYRTKSLRLYEQTLRAGNPETECQRRVRGYFIHWRVAVGSVPSHIATAHQKGNVMEGKKNQAAAQKSPATRGVSLRICVMLCLTLVSAPSKALVGPRLGPSTFTNNKCVTWDVSLTIVASELDPSELKDIMTYPNYTVRHMHALARRYGYPAEREFHSDTAEGRLGEINRWLFGTDHPKIGQTVTKTDGHSGDCTFQYGDPPECFGVLLGSRTNTWDPHVGPPPNVGGCRNVPAANMGCTFTLPAASLDVGAVQAGSSKEASMTVVYQCYKTPLPTVVDLGGGGSSLVDKKAGVSADIKIAGSELPVKLNDTSEGSHELKLDVTIRSGPDGSGPFSAAGVLEIEPQ